MLSLIYHNSRKKLSQHTLIISVRWHSGSRPAMGKILIFCVFEHLSASDSVIFLCVALSVEWGLQEMNKNTSLLSKYICQPAIPTSEEASEHFPFSKKKQAETQNNILDGDSNLFLFCSLLNHSNLHKWSKTWKGWVKKACTAWSPSRSSKLMGSRGIH